MQSPTNGRNEVGRGHSCDRALSRNPVSELDAKLAYDSRVSCMSEAGRLSRSLLLPSHSSITNPSSSQMMPRYPDFSPFGPPSHGSRANSHPVLTCHASPPVAWKRSQRVVTIVLRVALWAFAHVVHALPAVVALEVARRRTGSR
eukprot:4979974-Prymnesium_polylepis.1